MKSEQIYFLGILFAYSFYSTNVQANDRPNFIHIFADDLDYGANGCFGASNIKTPNIDLMADQRIKFTEFYSALPSYTALQERLLTGRYSQRTVVPIYESKSLIGIYDRGLSGPFTRIIFKSLKSGEQHFFRRIN